MTAASEETAPSQPFACDGRIGEEKLLELLAVGGEYPALDFKRELDLSDRKTKFGFIKDCAAMMNLPRGGYLVVGATDDGVPAPGASPSKEMFDSAILTQMVKGHVDCASDVQAQVHNVLIEGKMASFALIYVSPPFDGIPAVISKDGILKSDKGTQIVFRQGTVYTRQGTSNAPVNHQTWSQVLHNLRQNERNAARADVDALVHRLVQGMGSGAAPTQVTPDLKMDAATFADATRAILDSGQRPAIKRLLIHARNSYRAAYEDQQARTHVLDRIAAIACEGIQIDDIETVGIAVDTLFELYKDQLRDPTSTAGNPGATQRWLEIALRVFAIGTMAVRSDSLAAVPTIVLRPIGDASYSYRSWLRHALTEASRANILTGADGNVPGGWMIALTLELLSGRPELRPDLPDATESARDREAVNEALLDAAAQFDLLWCSLALASSERKNSGEFYPSCSAYHQHRAMPIVHRIDSDATARRDVFGDIDGRVVATSIIQVIVAAEHQSWQYGGYWAGKRDLSAEGFIRTYAMDDALNL
jgi:hypothetical protein